MEKIKLIETRKKRGFLQNEIAEKLYMNPSCYSTKRERRNRDYQRAMGKTRRNIRSSF